MTTNEPVLIVYKQRLQCVNFEMERWSDFHTEEKWFEQPQLNIKNCAAGWHFLKKSSSVQARQDFQRPREAKTIRPIWQQDPWTFQETTTSPRRQSRSQQPLKRSRHAGARRKDREHARSPKPKTRRSDFKSMLQIKLADAYRGGIMTLPFHGVPVFRKVWKQVFRCSTELTAF